MISLCLGLFGLLTVGDSEVLCAHAQGVLQKHPMTDGLPSVQPISYLPLYGVGYGDMSGSFQHHRL